MNTWISWTPNSFSACSCFIAVLFFPSVVDAQGLSDDLLSNDPAVALQLASQQDIDAYAKQLAADSHAAPPTAARQGLGRQGGFKPTFLTTTLPNDDGKPVGFTAQVKLATTREAQYATIELTVEATGTITMDRRIVLQCESSPGGYSPPRNGLIVDLPALVPQGSKTSVFRFQIPKPSFGTGLTVSLWEDGTEIRGYRESIGRPLKRPDRIPDESTNPETDLDAWFIDGGSQQDKLCIKSLFQQIPNGIMELRHRGPRGASGPPNYFLLSHGPKSRLATDWRFYQSCDLALVRAETLKSIIQQQPDVANAIYDWLLCGGCLFILQFEPSDDKDALFSMDGAGEMMSWRRFHDETMSPPYIRQQEQSGIQMRAVSAGTIFAHDLALGDVTRQNIADVAANIGYRRSTTLRRGVDPLLGDQRFGRWLIAGVSEPPVYTFMGLLTLFVILVGPVAYRQTTMNGRGYLMFAIAPILAIITTLLMFAYGVVADGFATTARVRQLTWVDSTTGRAAERVRATYFAGIRPRDGLTFSADAEVFCYQDSGDNGWETLALEQPSLMGQILIEGDRQVLSTGFLPSRQQRQFVTHQPKKKVGRLFVEPPSGEVNSPTVTSSFGFELRSVIVRDRSGDYWSIASLPAGGSTDACSPLIAKQVNEALGNTFNDFRQVSNRTNRRSGRTQQNTETRDFIALIGRNQLINSPVTDGVIEQWLQDHMQTSGELPLGTFVAISDVSKDAVWASDVELVDCVRFVFGTTQ